MQETDRLLKSDKSDQIELLNSSIQLQQATFYETLNDLQQFNDIMYLLERVYHDKDQDEQLRYTTQVAMDALTKHSTLLSNLIDIAIYRDATKLMEVLTPSEITERIAEMNNKTDEYSILKS